jgi:serine/threonine protein phosphatase PrpC
MKSPDPLSVIFAGSQLIGKQEIQADYFTNFNDECFVVSDGVKSMPYGEVAAKLASDTAIWGYKFVRHRPFYWADKRRLLKRIFRSTNLAVWQKRRETGFGDGLATALSVAIVGPTKIWVGNVGGGAILLYRESLIDVLTPSNGDALGLKRLGLVSHIAVSEFLSGDILILASSGVINSVSEEQIRATCEMTGETTETITTAVVHLLRIAEENGSNDNMTVCIVKRIKNSE